MGEDGVRTGTIPTHPNPMLLVVILRALHDRSGGGTIIGAVRSAAVHGWYEGHIEGEDSLRPRPVGVSAALATLADECIPTPPFPEVAPIREIVSQTMDRFPDDGTGIAAVAYAAGLGWRDGYAEGRACAGCSFRGGDPTLARSLRMKAEVELAIYDRHGELVVTEPPRTATSIMTRLIFAEPKTPKAKPKGRTPKTAAKRRPKSASQPPTRTVTRKRQ